VFLHVSFKIVSHTKSTASPYHREAHLALGEPLEYSIIVDLNLDFGSLSPFSSDVVLFITKKKIR
jgi:hypothetical protein